MKCVTPISTVSLMHLWYSTVQNGPGTNRVGFAWICTAPAQSAQDKNCDDFEWVARFCVGFATVNKSNAIKSRIKILSSITTQTFDRAVRARALQLFTRARVLSGHCPVNFEPYCAVTALVLNMMTIRNKE